MKTIELMNQLISEGLSPAGAAGVAGNIACESNTEGCRVQGDFDRSRTVSKEYARRVDSGEYPAGAWAIDGKGWGLCQWTYHSRKRGLLEFAKANGKSIADEPMQVNYILLELNRDYPALNAYLCRTNDVYEATKKVCEEFERPAVNNIGPRTVAAKKALEEWKEADRVQHEEKQWPPRMLCKGMSGYDVTVLQAILRARGYADAVINGEFDAFTDLVVRQFQKDKNLDQDGVVGPLTWAKLLEV